MEQKRNHNKTKTAKPMDAKLKRILFLMLWALSYAAVLTVCTMCLSYTGGSFAMGAGDLIAVWLVFCGVFVVGTLVCVALKQDGLKNMAVIYITTTLVVVAAILCMRLRYLELYFVPLSVCSLLTVLLSNRRTAFVTLCINFLVVLLLYIYRGLQGIGELVPVEIVYLAIKFVFACIVVTRYKPNYNRINLIGLVMLCSVCAFLVSFGVCHTLGQLNFVDSIITSAWMLASDIVSLLLCLVLAPVLEWVLRLETNLKLLEYLSFDQPLLKELAEKAPGTFHHSLAVGNLAERCANAIGENVNLAKGAAYYHDVGKLQSPDFFTENQQDGYNPHDELTYENSAKIITRHTEVGYKMLLERHYPKLFADVAREHHGDGTVSYFYIKAQNITEGDVDSTTYRYAGPRPSTRIAAIVMIADTVEAATRSMQIKERDKLYAVIDKLIRDKRESGQFDNCDITMRDLAVIRDTLVDALVGVNHSRVDYPTRK